MKRNKKRNEPKRVPPFGKAQNTKGAEAGRFTGTYRARRRNRFKEAKAPDWLTFNRVMMMPYAKAAWGKPASRYERGVRPRWSKYKPKELGRAINHRRWSERAKEA